MDYTGRIGTASRPSMGASRLGTGSVGRPGSSSTGLGNTGRMGTASLRPGTGMRPGTGSLGAPPMTSRPVTQQGLAGAKMNMHVGRQIQDAPFFYAKLSEKLSQVTEMNDTLQQELMDIEKNSSKQLQLQSRLEEVKDEVKTLEVHLQDHNLVLQRGAVQASAADVEDQIRATNEEASQHNTRLQSMISARLEAETQAEALHEELEQLEPQFQQHLAAMPADQKAAYLAAQDEVAQWKAEVARLEETSTGLAREAHEAQVAIGKSRTRQDALQVQASMRALQADRAAAAEARAALDDCKGALERLSGDAQRSTAALEAARAQVKELQESLRTKEAALAGLRSSTAAGDGTRDGHEAQERREKYLALVSREREMQAALDASEDSTARLTAAGAATAARVRHAIEAMGPLLQAEREAAAGSGVDDLHSALEAAEARTASSKATAEELQVELEQRRAELDKVDALEEKLDAEMADISGTLATMQAELATFQDLDALHKAAAARRTRLTCLFDSLQSRAAMLGSEAAAREHRVAIKGDQLMATAWFQEFNKIETQLRDAASEAFHLHESIKTKEIDSDVEPIMASIRNVLGPLNLQVQQSV
eukprot:jgi/Ulvmu1/11229/UM072_0066.1